MNNVSGIYAISSLCKPERVYVGSAVNINERWRGHRRLLAQGKHCNRKLQNHYNKYGASDLIYRLLISCERNFLLKAEQAFIDFYNPYFNILHKAGSVLGMIHSKESRQKISEARLGKLMPEEVKGRISLAKKGVRFSDIHRKRLSDAKKGGRRSAETRGKISRGSLGRVIAEETRNKIGCARIGMKHSEATLKKMSDSHRGILLSEEHKRKIGEAQRGRHASDETKEKISKSKLGFGRIIINLETGIFYESIIGAAASAGKPRGWLSDRLTGHIENNTMFRYA